MYLNESNAAYQAAILSNLKEFSQMGALKREKGSHRGGLN